MQQDYGIDGEELTMECITIPTIQSSGADVKWYINGYAIAEEEGNQQYGKLSFEATMDSAGNYSCAVSVDESDFVFSENYTLKG